jgi:non-heme chloroperoxidase
MNTGPVSTKDFSALFYGANRDGSTVSLGLRDQLWQCMTVGLKGAYDCVKAFSTTDLTMDLEAIDVPTLIMSMPKHGAAANEWVHS